MESSTESSLYPYDVRNDSLRNPEQLSNYNINETSDMNIPINNFSLVSPLILQYALPVNGYINPFLVLFTIITNILVCVVLLKRHMRSPTNVLLVAMAISDLLTGVWPIPCFLYFYTMGNYIFPTPFGWCFAFECLTDFIPTIFHTASIWLTVTLAVQRYVYVCHSLRAKRWCTIQNVLKCIVFIYCLSIVTHLCRFFEKKYLPLSYPSMVNPNVTEETCQTQMVPFVDYYQEIYFGTYYWFRVFFIHLVPCAFLVVLNTLLIAAMRSAQTRRKQLLKQNRNSESRKLKESNCTTAMLVTVVGVFLVVELPLGILLIILIIENTMDIPLMQNGTTDIASLFINLCILFSYPLNFFIYCGMSRQFRETFKRLFLPGLAPMDREHSQYMTLATENGARTQGTNETAM